MLIIKLFLILIISINYPVISVTISTPCNSDPDGKYAVHVQLQLVADPLQEQDQVLMRRGFLHANVYLPQNSGAQ